MREKHGSTRAQLLEAVESRVAADQRTETLVHKWKIQLEARTRELESLQAKLVPQDLDMLRAKVQEELEIPHQRRMAGLENEVERHRQRYFNVRREYERCKVRISFEACLRVYQPIAQRPASFGLLPRTFSQRPEYLQQNETVPPANEGHVHNSQ